MSKRWLLLEGRNLQQNVGKVYMWVSRRAGSGIDKESRRHDDFDIDLKAHWVFYSFLFISSSSTQVWRIKLKLDNMTKVSPSFLHSPNLSLPLFFSMACWHVHFVLQVPHVGLSWKSMRKFKAVPQQENRPHPHDRTRSYAVSILRTTEHEHTKGNHLILTEESQMWLPFLYTRKWWKSETGWKIADPPRLLNKPS